MRACGGYGRAISMVLEVAIPIAKEEGVSPATICLAWLLARPVVTSVIIGAKRMDQLRENLATVEFVISVDEAVGLNERARVATISTPTKILPQEGSVGKREQLFLAVRVPQLMHAEFDTLFWPKSYPCVDLGRSRGSQREPKAAQYRGQTKDSFSHGRCTHENRFRTANT